MGKRALYLVLVTFFVTFFINQSTAQTERGWILFHKMLKQMDDLTIQDRVDVILALNDSLDDVLPVDYEWQSDEIDGIRSLIATGFSFDYPPEKIAAACKILFQSYKFGAIKREALNFLEVILSGELTARRLATLTRISAKLAGLGDDFRIPFLREITANDYPEENIAAASDFLLNAQNKHISLDRALVVAIVNLKQISDSRALKSELSAALNDLLRQRAKQDRLIRYTAIAGNFYNRFPSKDFLNDVTIEAVDKNWSKESFIHLLTTLEKAAKEQLDYESLYAKILQRIGSEHLLSDKEFKKICDNEFQIQKKKSIHRQQANANRQNVEPAHLNESEFSKKLRKIVDEYLGTPYLWGGNSKWGIDCSGFTQRVFSRLGISLPRVSHQQYRSGKKIPQDQLRPGDLVFFSNNYYNEVDHVGIYLGNGKFCHASCSKGVTISNFNKHYYQVHYVGAKRYFEL
ncbi:hypothetical protein B6D60_02010 [candidate division KSB1 bacterium 4484_87]|nr:MAG: hypothetical protein B6D60_02010 [candidate division KSB1 bacterium 4484_87]